MTNVRTGPLPNSRSSHLTPWQTRATCMHKIEGQTQINCVSNTLNRPTYSAAAIVSEHLSRGRRVLFGEKKVRAFRSLRESPLAPYLYETPPKYRLGNMVDPPSPTLSESGSAAGRPGEKRTRKPSPTTVRKTHVREHSPVGTLIPSRICRSSRIFFWRRPQTCGAK